MHVIHWVTSGKLQQDCSRTLWAASLARRKHIYIYIYIYTSLTTGCYLYGVPNILVDTGHHSTSGNTGHGTQSCLIPGETPSCWRAVFHWLFLNWTVAHQNVSSIFFWIVQCNSMMLSDCQVVVLSRNFYNSWRMLHSRRWSVVWSPETIHCLHFRHNNPSHAAFTKTKCCLVSWNNPSSTL